jgi:hypothetical protein
VAPVQGLDVDERDDLLVRPHCLAARCRRTGGGVGPGCRPGQQQVPHHVGGVCLDRLHPPGVPGVGEGPVDEGLEAGVDLGHLLGGQAQQQVAHAVGLVPAAHATLSVEPPGPLLTVLVGLGPLLGDLAAQIVERLALGRVEQLVLGGGRRAGALGHLVGLVDGDPSLPHRLVGSPWRTRFDSATRTQFLRISSRLRRCSVGV